MSVLYHYTNEPLEAITSGLDMNPSDDVIGVCSSVCLPSAAIQYVRSFLAADTDAEQAEYALRRIEMLRQGNIEGFLRPVPESELRGIKKILPGGRIGYVRETEKKCMERSIAYFSEPGRLEQIRQNIGRLEIRHVNDFLEAMEEGRFSKAYLSNIIGYRGFKADPNEQGEFVREIAGRLRSPGLIYISRADRLCFGHIAGLEKDEALTKAASGKGIHRWQPAVYRRTR